MDKALYESMCNAFQSGRLEFVVTRSEAERFYAFCIYRGFPIAKDFLPVPAGIAVFVTRMRYGIVQTDHPGTPVRPKVERIAFAETYDLDKENAAAAKMIKLMEKPMVVPTNDDWAKAKEWGTDVHIRRQKAKDLLAEVVAAQSLLEGIFKALTEFVQQTGSL